MSKRKRSFKDIPVKKVKDISDKNISFDIDKYIDDKVSEYAKKVREEAISDFALLESLTDNFLEFTEDEKDFPFEYSTMGSPYQLSYVREKAIEIFQHEIEKKGYKLTVNQYEHCRRYTTYKIIIT